jgi:hypothetical protein
VNDAPGRLDVVTAANDDFSRAREPIFVRSDDVLRRRDDVSSWPNIIAGERNDVPASRKTSLRAERMSSGHPDEGPEREYVVPEVRADSFVLRYRVFVSRDALSELRGLVHRHRSDRPGPIHRRLR